MDLLVTINLPKLKLASKVANKSLLMLKHFLLIWRLRTGLNQFKIMQIYQLNSRLPLNHAKVWMKILPALKPGHKFSLSQQSLLRQSQKIGFSINVESKRILQQSKQTGQQETTSKLVLTLLMVLYSLLDQ